MTKRIIYLKAAKKPPKRGRGELSHEERRKVLDATVRETFAKEGLDALTRVNICGKLGITTGMINHHYGGADDMRAWAVQDAVERKDVPALKLMVKHGYELPAMPRSLLRLCRAAA